MKIRISPRPGSPLSQSGSFENKVWVIKTVRALTGMGLKEAKDTVEDMGQFGFADFDIPDRIANNKEAFEEAMQSLQESTDVVANYNTSRHRELIVSAVRSAHDLAMEHRDYEMAKALVGLLEEHDPESYKNG